MMDLLLGMVIGWGLITVLITLYGVLLHTTSQIPRQRRNGARLMFGAGLWPAVVVVLIVRDLRSAWREADWKGL